MEANPRDIRRATAAYYGMTESLDERYGKILNKLEELGQDIDDWLIIYTSDHGDMLGEHGVWEKTSFFEGSVRVPLFIRFPKDWREAMKKGTKTIEQNVNTCDLFATLCDYTGIPMPEGTDSRSLVPLSEDNEDEWPNESVSQLRGNLMIKQDHLKYCFYENKKDTPHAEVLFNLKKDPDETRDVSRDPAYAEAIEKFRKRRIELKY